MRETVKNHGMQLAEINEKYTKKFLYFSFRNTNEVNKYNFYKNTPKKKTLVNLKVKSEMLNIFITPADT